MGAKNSPGTSLLAKQPIDRLLMPLHAFTRIEASGGILLMACTVVALVWANSPWHEAYEHLWHMDVTFGAGTFVLSQTLHHWINDGLMAIFFFVVGLEIKREILVGELSSRKKASLPIAAALGGMVAPALIYAAFNAGTEGSAGWGIPMATDIAFAMGILALLGHRAPLSLKVFLVALAIVDDLGAVLVIAIFYTDHISGFALALGCVFLALSAIANRLGVRQPLVYVLLGIGLWFGFLKSGIHATIAGVLLAMTIPARARIDVAGFVDRVKHTMDRLVHLDAATMPSDAKQAAIHELEEACEQVQMPLQRIEHALHPWVTFGIVPIFALANAGVHFGGDVSFGSAMVQPVTFGIILGLVLGKQIGITLFTWFAVRLGLAELPAGITWMQIYGVGWLGGIGFTMSLFIANLAFGDGHLLTLSKVGILTASLIAGVVGYLLVYGAGVAPRDESS